MSSNRSSRRSFLSGFLNPLKAAAEATERQAQGKFSPPPPLDSPSLGVAHHPAMPPEPTTPPTGGEALLDLVAVVQGRQCLAATGFCRTCLERCPVPGAIEMDHGVPMVVPAKCTGCRICHDVCPAPTNAILMVKRRPGTPRPSATAPSPVDE